MCKYLCRCHFRLATFADARLATVQAQLDSPEHAHRCASIAANEAALASENAAWDALPAKFNVNVQPAKGVHKRRTRLRAVIARVSADVAEVESQPRVYCEVRP